MTDAQIIIVGAGPAGAMLAKILAEKHIRVVLIEREMEIGYPNKSSAGTPIDTIETFGLPRSVYYEPISGFRIYGPRESCEFSFDRPVGTVLNFRELKQYLVKEAIRYGCSVILGSSVYKLLKKDGAVAGVYYRGYQGEGRLAAHLVVDASGPEGVIATKLGLWQKDPHKLGVAFEYFLRNAKPDRRRIGYNLDLFFGSSVAPGGYAWIFPTSETEVKAGVCKLNPNVHPDHEESQLAYFTTLWRNNHQIIGAQPYEIHDCAHYITGGEKTSVSDHFLAIGDAVNKVNPIFGEGIRAALYSATFAAEAILVAVKKNDFSQKTLRLYDELWKKKWGANWLFSKIMFSVFYQAGDDHIDRLLVSMRTFNPNILYNLYVGKADKKDYLSFLSKLPSLVTVQSMRLLAKSFFNR